MNSTFRSNEFDLQRKSFWKRIICEFRNHHAKKFLHQVLTLLTKVKCVYRCGSRFSNSNHIYCAVICYEKASMIGLLYNHLKKFQETQESTFTLYLPNRKGDSISLVGNCKLKNQKLKLTQTMRLTFARIIPNEKVLNCLLL